MSFDKSYEIKLAPLQQKKKKNRNTKYRYDTYKL